MHYRKQWIRDIRSGCQFRKTILPQLPEGSRAYRIYRISPLQTSQVNIQNISGKNHTHDKKNCENTQNRCNSSTNRRLQSVFYILCQRPKERLYYTVHDLNQHESDTMTFLGRLLHKYVVWCTHTYLKIIPNLTTSSQHQYETLKKATRINTLYSIISPR